jgi:hypothetical protein
VNIAPTWDNTWTAQDCDVYLTCSYNTGSFTDTDVTDTHTITATYSDDTALDGFIIWTEGTTSFSFTG